MKFKVSWENKVISFAEVEANSKAEAIRKARDLDSPDSFHNGIESNYKANTIKES